MSHFIGLEDVLDLGSFNSLNFGVMVQAVPQTHDQI